jgi:arylsulfatase A-like enzyme
VINRREFLAGAAAGAWSEGADKAPAPNILFLMPDQLRACALGFSGNEDVRTPNLDRLAGESLVFPNTIANTPVCCPARANILTGAYAHRNGMVANDLRLREGQATLATALRGAGYRTGFVGKWHLDGGPRLPGFIPPGERRHGFEFWAANECSHAHFNTQYFRDSPEPIPIGKFEAEAWADLGIEFLRATRSDHRPFLLSVQMGPPHDPYKAPPEFRGLYDAARLRMRPNWRGGAGSKVPGPEAIAEYYGMVSAVDHQIGRILGELEALGLARDTIVLFSSDHGDMLGSQGLTLKRKPWEESINVPGVVRFPRRLKPGRSDTVFTHVDFAPTLLGLCGIAVPKTMQGENILGRRRSDEALLQIFGPYEGDGTEGGWRGMRTRTHTYARYEHRPWLLYDNVKDPYQQHNLIDEPAAQSLRRHLERRLAEWMERTGDSWTLNWHEMVEDRGRLYRTRVFYTVAEYQEWVRTHPQ